MKGIIGIGGALAIGIVLILGAFFVKNSLTSPTEGVLVSADSFTREALKTDDANKNGKPDWQESLEAKVVNTIETPSSTILQGGDEPYTPPTTFTGKFSEAFFKDYMSGKVNGADFSDPSAFVGNAVKAIEENTQSKTHARNEMSITPDTPEAMHAYGNRIAEIIKAHPANGTNEGMILKNALQSNNPKLLDELESIRTDYIEIIAGTLEVKVPVSFVNGHVQLLNAYESILTDIEAMQLAFTDPLFALARVKSYPDHVEVLLQSYKNINALLIEHAVTYTNEEPGSFFYIFDT